MSIRTVGVIGAGTIGRGVAQSFAESGFEVVLVDISQAQLDSAVSQIRRDLLVQPMLLGRPLKEDASTIAARISTATELDALAEADFVVENVTENWDVKREVYQRIDAICRPGVIFGVNTSAVPITRVGSVTGRPRSSGCTS